MKKVILLMTLLVLSSYAYAEDLSDYPDIFIDNGNFDAYIVVGNKAPAYYVILQSKLLTFFSEYTGKTITGRAKLATDITDLEQNLIILGNPCENGLSLSMDSYPMSCDTLKNKAGIFLVENGGYFNLIVTGTDDDIKKFVDELINYKKENIEGTEYNVKEIENEDIPIKGENDDATIKPVGEVIDYKQKIIDELNARIANKTQEVVEPIKEEVKEEIKEAIEPSEVKEEVEVGFFAKILDWIKSLFD